MTFKKSTSPKHYYALDIMKLIMALAIMFVHICSENVSVHLVFKSLTSVYNFGVPFFYACSGFLFFMKYKHENKINHWAAYIKFTKRILVMYAVWSIIYFCFINWIQEGAGIEEIIKYFHTAMVFTTYATIWFLPSLWIGVSIVFFLFHKGLTVNKTSVIAFIAYIIGSLGYSYFSVIEGTVIGDIYDFYNTVFITTRNGVFSGFPFVMLGAYLAMAGVKRKIKSNFILMILFSSLFICEAIFIKYKLFTNVDMGLMLIPSVFFMMTWLIQLKLPFKARYARFRNLSMLIFLCQRLFITAIPSILPSSYMSEITNNSYLGLFVFVFSILLFSLLIEFASKKHRWLKIKW